MKFKFLAIITLITLLSALYVPSVALAAPLAGADADVAKLFFDNSGFTEDTTDANSAAADDVNWPATGGTTVYIGGAAKFQKILFNVSAENRGSSWNIDTAGNPGSFEYYDGAAWSDVTVVNDDGAWNATGILGFSLTPPGDWASTTVNGADNFYVRVNCDMNCNQMMGTFDIDQISLLNDASAPVPEFSTYVLFFTLCLAGFVTFKKSQLQTSN